MADQMRSSRAAVHTEPLSQLHQRRTRLVEGHQLVHPRRAQKGLSHPTARTIRPARPLQTAPAASGPAGRHPATCEKPPSSRPGKGS